VIGVIACLLPVSSLLSHFNRATDFVRTEPRAIPYAACTLLPEVRAGCGDPPPGSVRGWEQQVNLAIGLVATMAAPVLGLVVSAAASSFFSQRDEIKANIRKIVVLATESKTSVPVSGRWGYAD